jgi:hypothetical protein
MQWQHACARPNSSEDTGFGGRPTPGTASATAKPLHARRRAPAAAVVTNAEGGRQRGTGPSMFALDVRPRCPPPSMSARPRCPPTLDVRPPSMSARPRCSPTLDVRPPSMSARPRCPPALDVRPPSMFARPRRHCRFSSPPATSFSERTRAPGVPNIRAVMEPHSLRSPSLVRSSTTAKIACVSRGTPRNTVQPAIDGAAPG